MKGLKTKLLYVLSACVIFTSFSIQNVKADADGSSVNFGVEWVQWYIGTGSPVQQDISTAASAVSMDRLVNTNPNWKPGFSWGNSDVYELDFKSSSFGGNDYKLADDVDLLMYCGHGVKPGSYGASDWSLIMNNQHNSYYAKQGDMRLGDRDLEWFVTFTCNFTNGSANDIGRIFNGLHAVCGYKTNMTVTGNASDRFLYWACNQSYPISTAYENYAWDTQQASWQNSIRVMRASSCWNDHLWGFGSVASDPTWYVNSPSSYSFYEADIW